MSTFPKAVLFDLGNTVLKIDEVNMLRTFSRVFELGKNNKGASFFKCGMIGKEIGEMLDKEANTSHHEFPFRAFVQLFSDRTGITFEMPYAELEMEIWKAMHVFSPEPGIREVLAELTARNIPMGVVSNAAFSTEMLQWEMAKHDLLKPFQFVISSADCIYRKPHPEIFKSAAIRLGFAPKDIWFVGDVFDWDIVGSHAAGMQPVWYNPKKKSVPKSEKIAPNAWREIRTWGEFLTA
jgi:putative hydrolase of the HAD superfamily